MQCPVNTGNGKEPWVAYCARTMSPDVRGDFEAHLAVCEECRRQVAAQHAVWSSLDLWEPQLVSADFNRRLYARIEGDRQQPWYRRLLALEWSLGRVVPVGAACVAVVAAFLLKGPLPGDTHEYAVSDKHVNIEQVEQDLDDIDMLKQSGVVTPAALPAAPSEPL